MMTKSRTHLSRYHASARRQQCMPSSKDTWAVQTHEFAASPLQIRRAIKPYRAWIESRLGVPLAETMILWTPLPLNQLALLDCDYDSRLVQSWPEAVKRFADAVESVSHPPETTPWISLVERESRGSAEERLARYDTRQPYQLIWHDSPVALRMRGFDAEVIAAEITHRDTPEEGESRKDMLIVRRDAIGQLTGLLAGITEQKRAPRVRTLYGGTEEIEPFAWDRLTLAPEILHTLQQDFEMFFEDRQWYREMHVPHRRGYLLHGPPGNGKTSAVKAMLTSRGLTAYQLRLFDAKTDDDHLESVFRLAAERSPAMILLEDIDRAFPMTGGSKCRISLQTLLNCLDGVTTGTGIITVATANEPSLLDPAILRRPSRFDRVVLFANPTPELRRQYFARVHRDLANAELSMVVELSAGFSFAQLRETFIMAAQFARMGRRGLVPEDLLASLETLRGTNRQTERKRDTAGFVAPLSGQVFA